jgi:hypothetical protein
MEEYETAYIARSFDGKGSIFISRNPRKEYFSYS